MHIEMLKDRKKRIIDCLNHKGKGCKIYTGHTDKPNLYEE